MSEPLTREALMTCSARTRGHFHGAGFFGYWYQCIEHPRLQWQDKYWKRDRSASRHWIVDGEPVDNLDKALERLNQPLELSDEDLEQLAKASTEFVDLRRVLTNAGMRLTDRGLIEWKEGKCRLTDAGAAALKARGEHADRPS